MSVTTTPGTHEINPTFFYSTAGTFTPLVKITCTDGSTKTVERVDYMNYIQSIRCILRTGGVMKEED